MKKLICILLVFCMTTGMFSGCGRAKNTESSTESTEASSDSASAESSASTEATADTGGSGADATTAEGTGDTGGTDNTGSSGEAGVTGFFLDYGDKYVDPNLGPTGKTLAIPTTGPIGTWDIPVPFINPLGTQDLYTGSTSYKPDDALDIQYVDNFTEFSKRLYGDRWFMGVNESSGIPIQFLKDYAAQIGGTVFSSVYADRIIFMVKQPDAIWWCDAREAGNGFQMYVLRSIRFPRKDMAMRGERMLLSPLRAQVKSFRRYASAFPPESSGFSRKAGWRTEARLITGDMTKHWTVR